MPVRVLVPGGAGYIGAHVVRLLAACGHEAVVLDDLRSSSAERVGDFPLERIALEDTAAVIDVFRRWRPAAVIHMAGYISVAESVQEPERYWSNNLGAGASLLLAAARQPIGTFIFSSTAAVYGNAERVPIPESSPLRPACPYGASKLAFERLLGAAATALGFRAVALRYFNAAGAEVAWGVGEAHDPEEHLIPRVIHALSRGEAVQVYGNDYPTEDGTCIRDYIHVTDLAEAHLRALEAPLLPRTCSLNVGTGRGHSVLQVVEAVARRLAVKPQIHFADRRPGDPAALVADPAELRRALGWSASRSGLEEIVDSAVRWAESRSP